MSLTTRKRIEGWATVVLIVGFCVTTLHAQGFPIPSGLAVDGNWINLAITQGGFFTAASLMLWFWLKDVKRYEAEKRTLIQQFEEDKRAFLHEMISDRDTEIRRRTEEFHSLVNLHTENASLMAKMTGSIEQLLERGIRNTER